MFMESSVQGQFYYCNHCMSWARTIYINCPWSWVINPRLERENIPHCLLFSCPQINPFLTKTFGFLESDCKLLRKISETEYLLGFQGKEYEGINCALLELKRLYFTISQIDTWAQLYPTEWKWSELNWMYWTKLILSYFEWTQQKNYLEFCP